MAHKTPVPATINILLDWYENGQLDLNPAYQRDSNVWDKSRKEKFVYTMLNHSMYVIPTIYVNEKANVAGQLPLYEIVDGKQRITTIIEYVKGYKLDKYGQPEKDSDGNSVKSRLKSPKTGDIRFQNKSFSELPDVTQRFIKSADIPVIAFQQYTEEQMQEIFLLLQEGVSLNQGEKLNAMDKALNRAANQIEQSFTKLLHRIKPNAKRGYWNTAILHMLAVTVKEDIVTSFKPLRHLLNEPKSQTDIDLATVNVSDFLKYINGVVAVCDADKALAQHFNEVQLLGLYTAWNENAMVNITVNDFAFLWDKFMAGKALAKKQPDSDSIFSRYNGFTLEGSNRPDSRKERGRFIANYLKKQEAVY